jgi:archaellum biogenesis ATPase FlaH
MKIADVFISHKSEDAKLSKKIYDYLTSQGLTVFESNHTLKESSNANFIDEIDENLRTVQNMVVVSSSLSNIESKWVAHEWKTFLGELRSEKKNGNIITVYAPPLTLNDIPFSLNSGGLTCIPYKEEEFYVI